MNSPQQYEVPEKLRQGWQDIVDLIVRLTAVKVGLVMQVVGDQIAVLVSSRTANNPYHVGDSEHLEDSGLYCETVVKQRAPLQVPNALQDPLWDHNPDLKFGLVAYLGFPICYPDGRILGTLCVLDDKENRFSSDVIALMAKMKELIESHLAVEEYAADLEWYRTQLEQMVESRTASLVIAKDAAVAADKAKTVFLANMSHELRTPMNGIMGMTALAKRTSTDPKQKNYLDKVESSAKHLLGVINNLLDIANIESSRLVLAMIPFSLRELLDKLRQTYADTARARNVTLEIDTVEEIANLPLIGDPVRLGQIVLHLVDNALRFTTTGSVTVRLRAGGTRDSRRCILIEVQDTGMGIAKEDQDRIFKAFEQVDMSQTRHFGGAGLGLALCHKLVSLMGGKITVDSEPGKGSLFRFDVLLAEAGKNDEAQSADGKSFKDLLPGFGAANILLVAAPARRDPLSAWLLSCI